MSLQNFQIHLGSYDGVLIGFQGTVKRLENTYCFGASTGSLRTLCVLGKYLFAGGFDEIIKVFNLAKMKEDGQLEGHEGSIACMKGFQNFLFSGGEDGNILVWKTKDWGLMHKIQAHTKAVLDLAIHTSGKLMISIGKEQKLIIWNLINFQKTFTRKFSYEVFKARFNSKEDLIILMGEKKIHLLQIETNRMLKVLVHEQKIHDFLVYGDNFLLVGDELGEIYIWDLSTPAPDQKESGKENEENDEKEENNEGKTSTSAYVKFKAHDKRIKQIQILKLDNMDYLISSSSDGFIKIWDVLYLVQKGQQISGAQDLADKVKSVFSIDSRERVCCMEANLIVSQNTENAATMEEKEEILGEESNVNLRKAKKQGKKTEKKEEVQIEKKKKKGETKKKILKKDKDGGNQPVKKIKKDKKLLKKKKLK